MCAATVLGEGVDMVVLEGRQTHSDGHFGNSKEAQCNEAVEEGKQEDQWGSSADITPKNPEYKLVVGGATRVRMT